ncbi:MAG: cytochrome ubiquinol oxidase subunit I, partial [Bacteroidales bacterium]|nr:cytochrome ubiquinol oxidase subunit I [Bacteroidales bacterium]
LEGLYDGREGASLVTIGILSKDPDDLSGRNIKDFSFRIEIPNLLSYMAYGDFKAFVPGINDLVDGNTEYGLLAVQEKIERGKVARESLAEMKDARDSGDSAAFNLIKARFYDQDFNNKYFRYFGYGFLNNPDSVIPNVPVTFYSFHLMVGLGFYFILLFIFSLIFLFRDSLEKRVFFLRLALFTIPLAYLATMAGWIVSEMGRQPWVIQDLLPNVAAISHINASTVQITFWMFAALFTILLIAEISIMVKQIRTGPKNGGK